jgi:sec-independent protein translocase protein TatB
MKEQFETAASDVQNTVQREVQQVESSWSGAAAGAGDSGTAPMMSILTPPTYKRPSKKWRLKRSATPMWFKQRQGVRRQAQSGAARVARFRPPRLR